MIFMGGSYNLTKQVLQAAQETRDNFYKQRRIEIDVKRAKNRWDGDAKWVFESPTSPNCIFVLALGINF